VILLGTLTPSCGWIVSWQQTTDGRYVGSGDHRLTTRIVAPQSTLNGERRNSRRQHVNTRTLLTLIACCAAAPAEAQGYSPFWSDSGEVRFVRAASDSTVIEMDVRYAPTRGRIASSVLFSLWVIRCGAGAKQEWSMANLSFGQNESELLAEASRSRTVVFHAIRPAEDSPSGWFIVSACRDVHDRKKP
jgi:hypothetical protein